MNFPISLPDDKLYWTGTWEKRIGEAIAAVIPSGGVCLDIGSHRGFMAGIMARNGASCVYCFEPNPINLTRLKQLKRLNPALDLRLMPLAVGSANGRATFSFMPESTMGKLSDSPFQAEEEACGTLDVSVRTLDDLLQRGDIEPPSLIKVDVEGSEVEVLRGAASLILEHHPVWIIEVHGLSLGLECSHILERAGYSVRVIETGYPLDPLAPWNLCHLQTGWR
ncbi:MAG: FkbM family methyltransferase [Magnetococcales bacterium]|nr:FkbM family methyltransferase [Magnetococcales bacterium]